MEHTTSEVSFHHEPTSDKSRIWKTTIILSVITLIELGFDFLMYFTWAR